MAGICHIGCSVICSIKCGCCLVQGLFSLKEDGVCTKLFVLGCERRCVLDLILCRLDALVRRKLIVVLEGEGMENTVGSDTFDFKCVLALFEIEEVRIVVKTFLILDRILYPAIVSDLTGTQVVVLTVTLDFGFILPVTVEG